MKTQKSKNSTVISILIILFFLAGLQTNTNAQEGAYWMGLSTKNPALIGTQSDWVWGSAQFADIPGYDGGYSNFALISDYRISPKAGSVGANFIRTSSRTNTAYLAELAYAYTLGMKKNREWNFGMSAGLEGLSSDYTHYEDVPNNNPKASYFKTNIGALYHSRKLDLGFSYAFFNEVKNDYSSRSLGDNYFVFITAYRFYIKEKFVIEPNLRMDFYGEGDNDGCLGIHCEYDNFVWLGSETTGDLNSIYTGADVSNRFRIALKYTYSDYYQFGRTQYYQITLGYKLN